MDSCALLLAAGFGSRLRPATEKYAKSLIPVAGIEPLFFNLLMLERVGITKTIINLHYRAEDIIQAVESWLAEGHFAAMTIKFSYEKEILGSGGALLKVFSEHKDWLSDKSLLVLNADTVAGWPLSTLCDSLAKNDWVFAVSSQEHWLKNYSPICLGTNNEWLGVGQSAVELHSAKAAHFLGAYLLSPHFLESFFKLGLEAKATALFEGIWRRASEMGLTSKAIDINLEQGGFWFDMTSANHLLSAQAQLLKSACEDNSHLWSWALSKRYPDIHYYPELKLWSNRPLKELSSSQGPGLVVSGQKFFSSARFFESVFIDRSCDGKGSPKKVAFPASVKGSAIFVRPGTGSKVDSIEESPLNQAKLDKQLLIV